MFAGCFILVFVYAVFRYILALLLFVLRDRIRCKTEYVSNAINRSRRLFSLSGFANLSKKNYQSAGVQIQRFRSVKVSHPIYRHNCIFFLFLPFCRFLTNKRVHNLPQNISCRQFKLLLKHFCFGVLSTQLLHTDTRIFARISVMQIPAAKVFFKFSPNDRNVFFKFNI